MERNGFRLGRIIRMLAIAATIILLAAAGAWYWRAAYEKKNPLPQEIKGQLDFVVLYPAASREVAVERSSLKYDRGSGVLSFVADTYGISNTITEQASPENFSDIPQSYAKVIEKMYGYASFDTDAGRVDLTRPAELGGDQVAVMNAKGTLLFAHAEKDLNMSQWRKLFNNMQVVK